MVLAYRVPDWDFRCYLNAGELLRSGQSPYSPSLGTQYLYPPPLAHLIAFALEFASPRAIFVGFQALQVALVIAAFCLLRVLAIRCGAPPATATMLAAALTIVNLPLFYNVRHHQVNLVLLDASLAAMLFPRHAAMSGLLLAAATTLKLYPALLLAPLWMFGYRRIALWWAAGMLAPLAFEGVRRDWAGFFEILPGMPKGEGVLDNSVTSLIERGLDAASASASPTTVKAMAAAVAIAALALVAIRLLSRRRSFLHSAAEWTAVPLLMSPIAWEQHFVIAMPLALILLIERPRHVAVLAGTALMLWLPRTPIFPFSHHYLAGLIALFAVPRHRQDRT